MRATRYRMQIEALANYILSAMISWTPLSSLVAYGETEVEVRARFKAIAADIAAVSADPAEQAAFSGPTGRVRTALLIASIGSFEGGWQKFVEEGDCNRTGFHADRRGGCDGGHAFTSWQIHIAGGGFLFVDGRLTNKTYAASYAKEHPSEIIDGPALVANRQLAVRVAKDLIIETKTDRCVLCGYSGESSFGEHPKADARLDRAKDYWAKHPYVEPQEVAADARLTQNP